MDIWSCEPKAVNFIRGGNVFGKLIAGVERTEVYRKTMSKLKNIISRYGWVEISVC